MKLPGEEASNKMRSSTSHRRAMMLSVFWDRHGIIMLDFLPIGRTMNAKYYSDLVVEVRRKRRKQRNTPLWLLHDNAPIHKAAVMDSTIENAGLTLIQHPPYSPALAPSDFWLFNRLKKHLRGHHFDTDQELQESVEVFFSSLSEDFFEDAFSCLLERWRKCVENNGG